MNKISINNAKFNDALKEYTKRNNRKVINNRIENTKLHNKNIILKDEKIDIKDFAIYLKNNPTPMEALINNAFFKKRKERYRFQQILEDKFVVDFYCRPIKLIIEIDGYTHDYKEKYDLFRENILLSKGYNLVRFNDSEVNRNLEGVTTVISHIYKYLNVLKNHNIIIEGRKFTCSPWINGVPLEFKTFTIEEQKAPIGAFDY